MGSATAHGKQAVRTVVCDTGPLLHLAEAQAAELLHLVGELHIPPAVDAEMTHHNANWRSGQAHIQVTRLAPRYKGEAAAWRKAGLLDLGEAEAIQLALQFRAEWFLTDDGAARLVAQSIGLETHGSLGIVLWAAAVGHLTRTAAEGALDGLAKSSLWISHAVLDEAHAALNELLPPFES